MNKMKLFLYFLLAAVFVGALIAPRMILMNKMHNAVQIGESRTDFGQVFPLISADKKTVGALAIFHQAEENSTKLDKWLGANFDFKQTAFGEFCLIGDELSCERLRSDRIQVGLNLECTQQMRADVHIKYEQLNYVSANVKFRIDSNSFPSEIDLKFGEAINAIGDFNCSEIMPALFETNVNGQFIPIGGSS